MANKKKNTEVKETVEQVTPEVTEAPVVESAEVKESTQPVKQELKPAKIKGCELLNIRAKASLESDKLGVLSKSSKFEVFPAKPGSEWVKIVTDAGVKGFAMAKFVTVK